MNSNKINGELLLANGYKRFTDSFKRAKCGYQKRVGHTRYFINIYEYDFSGYASFPSDRNPISYEVDVQFQDQDENYLNISFSVRDMSLEQIEAKVENVFTTLHCMDYE